MLLAVLTAAATAVGALVVTPPVAAASSTESAFVSKINAARAAQGLTTLVVRSDLTSYARSHSAAMARRGSLFHTSDFSVICCWRTVAENVGFGPDVSTIHTMFMNSPEHRANILDARMREVGVGVVSVNGQLWVTEIFRAPSGSTAGATTRRISSPRAAAPRAARSAVRVLPTFTQVLGSRMARLSRAVPAQDARDPLTRALGWSERMRALCAPG